MGKKKRKKIRALEVEVTDLRVQIEVLTARVSMLETCNRPSPSYDPFRPIGPGPGQPLEIWCSQEISDMIDAAARSDASPSAKA